MARRVIGTGLAVHPFGGRDSRLTGACANTISRGPVAAAGLILSPAGRRARFPPAPWGRSRWSGTTAGSVRFPLIALGAPRRCGRRAVQSSRFTFCRSGILSLNGGPWEGLRNFAPSRAPKSRPISQVRAGHPWTLAKGCRSARLPGEPLDPKHGPTGSLRRCPRSACRPPGIFRRSAPPRPRGGREPGAVCSSGSVPGNRARTVCRSWAD